MNAGQPRARVLVVDDEADLVRILQFGLQGIGYQVETASDGQEALKKAREQKPDIILLDLMLPKLDGYKVCRLLKFDERYKNIP
ncbi:MAG: response regulator, partial [Candidatus Eisenbacteria bacterium]